MRSWFAHRLYEIINKISDEDIVDGARDFRLMKREMVEAIVSMTEYNRFSKGIFGWIGFKTYWLSYDNIERVAGETKWNFWKLTKYAIDGIINFSQAPLSAVSGFGVLMTVVSFLMLVVVVGSKLIYGDPVAGWASTDVYKRQTYNGEKYLKAQLDSIFEQTYKNFVLFIRDDGSSDHTVEIIQNYRKQNDFIASRIRFVKGKNVGWQRSFWLLLEQRDVYKRQV